MMSPLKKLLLIVLLVNYFSCSSNLDFDQVQQIETTPIFNISLGFFSVTSPGFSGVSSISSAPITSITEDIEYRIFENSILRNNLAKQEYSIEIANTFNRAFEIEISFLDSDGNNTYKSYSYTVNALDTNFREIIAINDIDDEYSNVKNTTTLRIEISLEDKSTPLNPASTGSFNFKSYTTLYLKTSINNQE